MWRGAGAKLWHRRRGAARRPAASLAAVAGDDSRWRWSGMAALSAGRGGADWRRRTEGNGVKGRCRVQERTAANIFFSISNVISKKNIVFLKVYIYYFSISCLDVYVFF